MDLLVEDWLLVEVKAARAMDDAHRLQCINYLKATALSLCLLLNFGRPRLEVKRVANGQATAPSACISVHPLPSA